MSVHYADSKQWFYWKKLKVKPKLENHIICIILCLSSCGTGEGESIFSRDMALVLSSVSCTTNLLKVQFHTSLWASKQYLCNSSTSNQLPILTNCQSAVHHCFILKISHSCCQKLVNPFFSDMRFNSLILFVTAVCVKTSKVICVSHTQFSDQLWNNFSWYQLILHLPNLIIYIALEMWSNRQSWKLTWSSICPPSKCCPIHLWYDNKD